MTHLRNLLSLLLVGGFLPSVLPSFRPSVLVPGTLLAQASPPQVPVKAGTGSG